MRNRILLFFLLLFVGANAQSYQWSLTNSPVPSYRFEDIYFLNPDTGFAVHYYDVPYGGEPGYIMKTVDGGTTWIKVLDSTNFQFRDVGFTDAMHGWVGTFEHTNIGADTNIMFQTTDGGVTWSGVPDFPGPDSAGICGLRVINDSTIYGVGRYEGHAGFYKTTNNGLSWSYKNLDSLASGLVDISFFNADTGFVIGTSGPLYYSGYGRILYTTDAGNTWTIAYTSWQPWSLGWKISFPSRLVGYCSLQIFNNPATETFVKTTDGGLTWHDVMYIGGPSNGYNVEGLGFINDTTGWVGGSTHLFFTQNGGINWVQQTWGNNVNRFRFLSDTLAYCAGQGVYKLHVSPAGINDISQRIFLNNYPNPATDYAYFEFFVYQPSRAKLSVYDMNGKEVEKVFDKDFGYGNQHFIWLPNLPSGVYLCKLTISDNVLFRKIEIVK